MEKCSASSGLTSEQKEAILRACDEFFQSNSPPTNLSEVKGQAQDFIEENHRLGKMVVLVTVSPTGHGMCMWLSCK